MTKCGVRLSPSFPLLSAWKCQSTCFTNRGAQPRTKIQSRDAESCWEFCVTEQTAEICMCFPELSNICSLWTAGLCNYTNTHTHTERSRVWHQQPCECRNKWKNRSRERSGSVSARCPLIYWKISAVVFYDRDFQKCCSISFTSW